jgi:hypothetical protein
MRNTLCATALVAIALLGAGCKKEPSLVGKWTGTMQNQQAEFEFKADNTMTISSKQGPASVVFNGDYKAEGEKVTMTLKDVKMQGVPPAMESMAKNALKPMLNKPETNTVKFASDDSVSITGTGNKTISLTRVKESS